MCFFHRVTWGGALLQPSLTVLDHDSGLLHVLPAPNFRPLVLGAVPAAFPDSPALSLLAYGNIVPFF